MMLNPLADAATPLRPPRTTQRHDGFPDRDGHRRVRVRARRTVLP
jgi:hypothetical protein